MIRCKQKYCKHCIKPVFDLGGNFAWGYCKVSKFIILQSDGRATIKYDIQPLYCDSYCERQREINY